MRTSTLICTVGFVILFVLHHDFWNWDNTNLLFGFVPVGLAYHAGFSIVAALFWFLTSKFAWPHHIEKWADKPNETP